MVHDTRRLAAWVPLITVCAACGGGSGTAAPSSPAPADSTPAATAPVVQPGAPGQAARSFDPADASALEDAPYSPADVRFMQGMIPHHAQALVMTGLVPDRTDDTGFRQLALRMEISQKDEIGLMERWLENRGEALPDPTEMVMMPGMLTAAQMESLTAARGVVFERLFLELMTQHHQGAIEMVATLFAARGGGQESEIFQFATDVDVDQRMEIERMQRMLEERR